MAAKNRQVFGGPFVLKIFFILPERSVSGAQANLALAREFF